MAIKDLDALFTSLDPEYYDILMKWVPLGLTFEVCIFCDNLVVVLETF